MKDKIAKSFSPPPSLELGINVIADVVKTLTNCPGVYRMIDDNSNILYVGKAKGLKRRVASYTRPFKLPIRMQRMIAATRLVEIVETHTEVEALLLESNLIKKLRPRYNVMLRDDKSFPYLLLTDTKNWPQLIKHRGGRKQAGEYFGPFASVGAVNKTLASLQRAFPLRNCSDNIFYSRKRPCLQYQIKRCAAPCVDRISSKDYDLIVQETRNFLTGNSRDLQKNLLERMEEAAENMKFEQAAIYRDRVKALSQIQAHQDINVQAVDDADIIAGYNNGGLACIQVFFFRNGQNLGNRTYFPTNTSDLKASQIISSFISQFYIDKEPPKTILVSEELPECKLITDALSVRADAKVTIKKPLRGSKFSLIQHALTNAREALARRLAESQTQKRLLKCIAEVLHLTSSPDRIEVYDNSHISGTNAVGGMIVAGPDGFIKKAYRKFNIRGENLTPGDDYGMMKEVIKRRFKRSKREANQLLSENWPDLLIIDGGRGQLNAVHQIMTGLDINNIPIIAIAKGPDRNAGQEKIYMKNRAPLELKSTDPVLYYLQRLRDEAHRYAITSHRTKRKKELGKSPLDEISGVGANRKRALLHHFGSARGVGDAGVADLVTVEGISQPLAQKIYEHFHSDN
ncbi:MAG: excinuclease ABC subunit C [Rhodospirillaceae bacterium]|nr:excinuclease ABC subunit C [Rhodospirillaceae bacterium]